MLKRSALRQAVKSQSRLLFMLLVLLLAGTVFGQAQTAQQSALRPAGPIAQMQHDLFMWTVYVAIGIFVVVVGILLYAIIRFRGRPGHPEPRQIHGNHTLEIVWTVVPIILVITIAVPTVRGLFYMEELPEGDHVRIHVVGHQWWWEFEYPDFGIVTANELRIPTGKPVVLTLTSNDVIHSFWVPNLAGKLDTNPGKTNRMWLQADEPGVYHGQCAEFCGIAHANMRFRVVAEEPEAFEAWVERWSEAVAEVAVADDRLADVVTAGARAFRDNGCFACHAIEGHGFDGTLFNGRVGPNLSLFGTRSSVAAGMLENTAENLAAWIRNPQAVKPGNKMPVLNVPDEDIEAIVAYLHSLR